MGIDSLTAAPRRAVFLDRDGVINRPIIRNGQPFAPQSLAELEILPGVPEALARLKELGFLLIVVTNQPDVARGIQRRSVVDEIHAFLSAEFPLDQILCCFHDDQDGCACRKPLPGMLLEAATKFSIHLPLSFLIGDRWRDIDAGHAAGCRTVLVDYNHTERQPSAEPEARVSSLPQAVDWIVRQIT